MIPNDILLYLWTYFLLHIFTEINITWVYIVPYNYNNNFQNLYGKHFLSNWKQLKDI